MKSIIQTNTVYLENNLQQSSIEISWLLEGCHSATQATNHVIIKYHVSAFSQCINEHFILNAIPAFYFDL